MAMVHQSELFNGVATMRMAGEINIPAGSRIEMVPGGTHIMLEGLRAPLKTGDSFDLVLKFRKSGDRNGQGRGRQGGAAVSLSRLRLIVVGWWSVWSRLGVVVLIWRQSRAAADRITRRSARSAGRSP